MRRFDRFNAKYNPLGQSVLRTVFLKTHNHIGGKYLAEVTQEVMGDLKENKYSLVEWRLSVYGRDRHEWNRLARWVTKNKLASPEIRWMIQIPRLYSIYHKAGLVTCFQDMMTNIFEPLFRVTIDPSWDPELHAFLNLVTGFDSVDDESKHEGGRDAEVPLPEDWDSEHDPPYYYQMHFIAANLKSLNLLRRTRGLREFSFRPHSGEAGDIDHLAACLLTSESINHGINLRHLPALEYVYYLAQIGLSVSPLSNHRLFVDYKSSPFLGFLRRGHNVTLSSDDPLILHFTRDSLLEEYVIAAQVWKLSPPEIAEIMRNSLRISGFEEPYKRHWQGPAHVAPGPRGNDIFRTNVP